MCFDSMSFFCFEFRSATWYLSPKIHDVRVKIGSHHNLVMFVWSHNENNGQWKQYQRHIVNVSVTPVIIISALQIELQWSCCTWCHVRSPLASIQLSHMTTYASCHYVTTKTALCVLHFFTALFSWVANKNLQHDHYSSICNALMITGVIETFAICCWYCLHWPLFSL